MEMVIYFPYTLGYLLKAYLFNVLLEDENVKSRELISPSLSSPIELGMQSTGQGCLHLSQINLPSFWVDKDRNVTFYDRLT